MTATKSFMERLKNYEAQTLPLVDYYGMQESAG